jgi:UDP-xylose/UDP-N-acetylglucosamine transporter B4
MKFGEYLQAFLFPPWGDHYLSYERLKDMLYSMRDVLGKPQAAALSSSFREFLQADVDKIQTFYDHTKTELKHQLEHIQSRMRESHDRSVETRRDLEEIWSSLIMLKDFASLNYTGCVKILKKHDKIVGAVLGKMKASFIKEVVNSKPVFGVLDEVFRLHIQVQFLYADLFHEGNRLDAEVALGAAILEKVGASRRRHVQPRMLNFDIELDAVERRIVQSPPEKTASDSAMIFTRARVALMSVGEGTSSLPILWALFLIFVGGCGQTMILEYMVHEAPDCGPTLTFFQFLMIALFGIKDFLSCSFRERKITVLPRKISMIYHVSLVVLSWVAAYTSAQAFYYNISVSLHMVFKSGILVINMILGMILLRRRYSWEEIFAVLLVTIGVLVTTMASLPAKANSSSLSSSASFISWATGLSILTISLVLTGCLGVVQDMAYKSHGKHWKEVLFYVHFLGLPMNAMIGRRIVNDLVSWSLYKPQMWLALLSNGLLSWVGVRGIYNLTGLTTSLTTSLTITVRKFLSLALSALYFKEAAFSTQQWAGAVLVLIGSVLYTHGASSAATDQPKDKKKVSKVKIQ